MYKVVNTMCCIVIDNYRKPLNVGDRWKIVEIFVGILHLQVYTIGV